MKKFMLFLAALFLIGAVSAQQVRKSDVVIYPQATLSTYDVVKTPYAPTNRATLLSEGFETGNIPSTWLNLDVDGDTYKWACTCTGSGITWAGHNSNYSAGSGSYIDPPGPGNVNPDNWLITPQIGGSNRTLKYWVGINNPAYPAEKYQVLVSTTGTNPSDFTVIHSETLTPAAANWIEKTFDLSTYTGDIYIAFRNYGNNDMFTMMIDDVLVTGDSGPGGVDCPAVTAVTATIVEGNKVKVNWTAPTVTTDLTGYKIYQGGVEKGTVPVGTITWTSDALANGTYKFEVAATYSGDCVPVKVAAADIVINMCDKKVTAVDVEYSADCGTATISWDAVAKSDRGNIARGRVAYGGPKYIQFDADNIMGNTTINTTLECYGGGFYQEKLYCYKTAQDASQNPTTCTYQIVNSATGVIENSIVRAELYGTIISSVCYDYTSNIMYAVQGNPNKLSKVNLATGEQTQVALLSGLGTGMPLTFAINLAGNAFIIESSGGASGNAKLYSVNLATGACTAIGSGTGLSMNYAQSMAFDYNDAACPLYWAQIDQPTPGNIVTTWAKVNTTTGLATAVASSIGMEICALHFPYTHGAPPETKYNVYRDELKIAGPTEAITFEDKTFDKTKNYTWSVAVICPSGDDGEWVGKSMLACDATPPPPPCKPVTDVLATYDAETKEITVKWTAPAGDVTPTKYEIYKDEAKVGEATTLEFKDNVATLEEGEYTFEYCVLPIFGSDCDGTPAKACKDVSFTVGIKNYTTSFSIVPNPATKDITIKAVNNFSSIEVLSFLGQVVISQQNVGNSATLDIANLTNGVYFVRIVSETGTSVQKFVKK